MTPRPYRLGILAPSLLALTLLFPAPAARAQSVTTIATAALADWDDLEDYYEDLADRREEYLEDFADRREDYFEDYYDDLPGVYRYPALRPFYGATPGYGYSPYYPATPYGYPGVVGYGYGAYPYGGIPPYGYGYGAYGFGPDGGINIPLLGLGGISIWW